MTSQNFKRGDVVHIAERSEETGPFHYNTMGQGGNAIVLGSYVDLYGGSGERTPTYSLMFLPNGGTGAWFYQDQLSFVRHADEIDIHLVETAKAMKDGEQSDIAWIVMNWPKIRDNPPSPSLTALMALIGIREPWGSHGEWYTWMLNAQRTHTLLDPILQSGDIALIEVFCREHQATGRYV